MAFDLRNFIIHTGYPIDKVIGMQSGQYTTQPSGQLTPPLTVAHGLPGRPLPILVFSNYQDFRDSYDESSLVYAAETEYGVWAKAGVSDTEINGWNLTASPKTVYWRIVYLEASDTEMEVPYTAASADKFQFNTEYNYGKLVKEGAVTSNIDIAHNLGFYPQVLLWTEYNGRTARITAIDTDSTYQEASMPNVNTLRLRPGAVQPGSKIHYRIYGDD